MALNKLETCKFIGDHALEIAKLAEAANLPTLSFLAGMMKLQADTDAEALKARTKKVA